MGMLDEDDRGTNLLDTGAHFYDVYETADGKYVSIGSIEPQFYAELLRLTGLDRRRRVRRASMDKAQWPALKERSRRALQDQDPRRVVRRSWRAPTCASRRCSSLERGAAAPAQRRRRTFLELDGAVQPAPAPRSAGRRRNSRSPPAHAEHTREVLSAWGVSDDRIATLLDSGAVKQAG